jgi:clan AA aspartic protease (TIGR02281 family)
MEKDGGVYRIPCKINGLRLKFIFDTGATDVCISENVAVMMLENGYLDNSDILGSSSSQVADGRIVDNTRIKLKTIEIGDKVLKNIEAVVIHNQSAPLLLGQSAIKKLGKYTISGNKLIFGSSNNSNTQNLNINLNAAQVDELLKEAFDAYYNDVYSVAIEKFNIVDQNWGLSHYGLLRLADCYYYSEEYDIAKQIYTDIEDYIAEEYPDLEADVIYQIGRCYWLENDADNAIKYLNKAIYKATPWSSNYITAHKILCDIYYNLLDNQYQARRIIDNLIKQYLKFMDIELSDCWTKQYKDKTLADLLRHRYLLSPESDYDKYHIIAAAWGSSSDIEFCKKFHIEYSKQPSNYVYK